MNFSDIFKKSFLAGFSADLSLETIATYFAITAAFALYIFLVYRVVTRKTFYDKNFAVSTALISIIVCGIILTIQSSLVVSLGMVGALSIVRFRTAVKNPMDLTFLFWSIAVGIICGAQLPTVAAVLSAVVTLGILVLEAIPVAKAPQILVVSAQSGAVRKDLLKAVKAHTSAATVKSQTLEPGRMDLIIEVRVKDGMALMDAVSTVPGITRCSLVSHDGEVTF